MGRADLLDGDGSRGDSDAHGETVTTDSDAHGETVTTDSDAHGETVTTDSDAHGETVTTDLDAHGETVTAAARRPRPGRGRAATWRRGAVRGLTSESPAAASAVGSRQSQRGTAPLGQAPTGPGGAARGT